MNPKTSTELAQNQVPASSNRRGHLRTIGRNLVLDWGALIAVGVLWEILGHTLQLPWLPPLSAIVVELIHLVVSNELTPHLLSSLGTLVLGFSIALVAGLAIGTLMGLFPSVYLSLDVYVNALLVTPALIFAPILFAIFGLSDWTRVSLVFLYGVFVIIINTAAAIRNVDGPLLDMAASFGAPRSIAVRRIVFPAAFPLILAGIRLGVGRSVKGMINAEMFIAIVGIGGLVSQYGRQYDFVAVWAITLFILLLAIALNQGVNRIERRFVSWVG